MLSAVIHGQRRKGFNLELVIVVLVENIRMC